MASTLPDTAVQWASALAQGGPTADVATRSVLTGQLGRWIEWRLRQAYRLAEEDAEELMADVVFKFSVQPPDSPSTAWGWLTRMVNSTAIDWIRARKARTPEGGFVSVDGGEDGADPDGERTGLEVPDWRTEQSHEGRSFADCIARQLALMEAQHAKYAALIRMRLEEMESEEMAAVVYGVDVDDLTPEHKNNFKSMLSTARKVSVRYFQQCRA
jgi:DNA-directed RNA polymerase specialized sigma24 family protein